MTEFDDNLPTVGGEPSGEEPQVPVEEPAPVGDLPELPIDDVAVDDQAPAEESDTGLVAEPEPASAAEPEPAPGEEPASAAEPEPPSAAEPEPAPGAAAQPTAEAVPGAPDAALVEGVRGGLTWLPFAIYLGLWVVLAGLSVYFLQGATPEEPARWMPEYEPLLWSGVALTALGPVLSIAVWLVARARREKLERRGLFASAMTRGALVTFFGVTLWLGTLFVLELLAAGWTL